MGSKIPLLRGKRPPPWASSGPLWQQEPHPPTPKLGMSPTWSNWVSTYDFRSLNTSSAHATTGHSSSGPSWSLRSSLGTMSSLLMSQLGNSNTPHYSTAQGLYSTSASNIISVIRTETCQVGATRLGFFPEDAGTHYLCSVVSIAMHIAGSHIGLS